MKEKYADVKPVMKTE
jgi:hypothetical protein